MRNLRAGKESRSSKHLAEIHREKKLLSTYQGIISLIGLPVFFQNNLYVFGFWFNLPGSLF